MYMDKYTDDIDPIQTKLKPSVKEGKEIKAKYTCITCFS